MRPVLITAGATRNRIDAMRYISAHSSGQTGAHIASALGLNGVTFLGSPEACLRIPAECTRIAYTDTLDLLAKMQAWVHSHPDGLVVHAAAVGDYMIDPNDPQASGKRASGQEKLTIELVPTPKIVDQIHGWSARVFLVSFKAAPPGSNPQELESLARAQQVRTHSAMVLANTIGQTDTQVVVIDGDQAHHHPARDTALSQVIQRLIEVRVA